MNKSELIKQAAAGSAYRKGNEELSLTQLQVEAALTALNKVIRNELAKGEKVQIAGFGTFDVTLREEREGRNPSTGEPMVIPASKNVRFKAAKDLKEALK